MRNPSSIIKKPLITEKTSTQQGEANQYTFVVASDAKRDEIAAAIASHFKVEVASVRTLNVKGKVHESRRQRGVIVKTPDYKKAVVTLAKGSKIELV
jgi:large subunit ribosomal protein L23